MKWIIAIFLAISPPAPRASARRPHQSDAEPGADRIRRTPRVASIRPFPTGNHRQLRQTRGRRGPRNSRCLNRTPPKSATRNWQCFGTSPESAVRETAGHQVLARHQVARPQFRRERERPPVMRAEALGAGRQESVTAPDRLIAVGAEPLALGNLRVDEEDGLRVPVGHRRHLDQSGAQVPAASTGARGTRRAPAGHRGGGQPPHGARSPGHGRRADGGRWHGRRRLRSGSAGRGRRAGRRRHSLRLCGGARPQRSQYPPSIVPPQPGRRQDSPALSSWSPPVCPLPAGTDCSAAAPAGTTPAG